MPRYTEPSEPALAGLVANKYTVVAWVILLAGALAAVLAFVAYGVSGPSYNREVDVVAGLLPAFYVLLLALFAWGVLVGIAEIIEKLGRADR